MTLCKVPFKAQQYPLSNLERSNKIHLLQENKENSTATEAHGAINSCQPGLDLNQTFLNKCLLDPPIPKAQNTQKQILSNGYQEINWCLLGLDEQLLPLLQFTLQTFYLNFQLNVL